MVIPVLLLAARISAEPPQLVKDINTLATASHSYPGDFRELGGTVFFSAQDVTHGRELWKSDGTAAGTVLVKDVQTGSGSSSPGSFMVMGGALYFAADDGLGGRELWRSDGTAAGTQMLKDIRAGTTGSNLNSLVVAGSTLYFFAESGSTGFDLWKSDGTEAGTTVVRDIRSGNFGSNPSQVTAAGGVLYFTANDGTSGIELWRSDGTGPGTMMAADLTGDSGGSDPANLAAIGDRLFFVAGTEAYGRELWTYVASPPSPEIQVEASDGTPLPSNASSINLGTVNRAAPPVQTSLTVRNTGDDPLVISGASLHQIGFYFEITTALPGSIPAGGSAVIGISYDAPVNCSNPVPGSHGASLQITCNDADESTYNVWISAEPAQPRFSLLVNGSPSAFGFPIHHFGRTATGSTATAVVTVRNEGNSSLVTTAPFSAGGDTFTFTVTGPAQFSLGPFEQVAYTVTFAPVAAGSSFGSLAFATNDPCLSTISMLSFDGTGNAIPAALDSMVSAMEDAAFPGSSFSLPVSDADNDPLLLEIVTPPGHGSLHGLPFSATTFIAPISYVPHPDFQGTDTFTYRVYDGYQHSRTATVTIGVTNVNDPPLANAQVLETIEDTPLPVTLTATDIDSTEFTFAIVQAPAHGILSGSGATRTYTPDADYHGPDSFTFTANDGSTPDSPPATVSITVTQDNGTPEIDVRTAASVSVPSGGPVNIGNVERSAPPVLTTLTVRNTGSETLTGLSAVTIPLSPFPTETWEITTPLPQSIPPGDSADLVVSFDAPEDPSPSGVSLPSPAELRITSNDLDESQYSIFLSATPVKPEIAVEINGIVTASYDFGRFILPRSESIVVRIRNVGSSVLNSTSAIAPGTFPGFTISGPARFSLNPYDSAEYTVTLSPLAAGAYFAFLAVQTNDADEPSSMVSLGGRGNAPPVAYDTLRETDEDKTWEVSFPSALATDADGDYWSFQLISPPTHGNVVAAGVTHTYVPDAEWSGTDSFTFRVFDGLEYSDVATATIQISAVNDPPLALSQNISVVENASIPVTLTATDVDSAVLAYSIITQPAHGVLSGTGSNRTYTPTTDYEGQDQFTFQASDGEHTSSATVTLTVIPSVPEIAVELNTTPLSTGALLNLGDVERAASALVTNFTVRNIGTAPLTGLGAVIKNPGNGYQIVTSLPGSIAPGGSAVLGVSFDPAPVANPGAARTTLTANLEIASDDADENPFVLQLTAVPVQPELRLLVGGTPLTLPASHDFGRRANGSATPVTFVIRNAGSSPLATTAPVALAGPAFAVSGSGTFTLAPLAEASYAVSFTPPASGIHTGTLSLATNGFNAVTEISLTGRGNARPVASGGTLNTVEDTPLPGTAFELSATDADGDPLTYQIVTPPSHGSLADPAAAATRFLPDADFHGADSFTYRVSDGVEFSNTATVTINVSPVNDLPVALPLSSETPENTALPITLTATDVDSTALTYQIVTPPLHGTLTPAPPSLTYAPHLNYHGPDSFEFRVSDGDNSVNPNAQSTVTISVISDGVEPAELDVDSPQGTPVLHESTKNLGMSPVGSPVFVDFKLKNTGTASLTGSMPQSSGFQETDFIVTTAPVFLIAPGAETTLTVRFTPGGTGLRRTDLLIPTNDTDESPFTIHLQGLGTGPGLLDTAFAPDFQTTGGVVGMAEQPDGKVILGGYFPSLNGPDKPNLVRLDPAGGVDAVFVGTTNDTVSTVTILGDGKIVIGGFFSEVNGVARPFLARLHADGSLDESFAPVINGYINCVAVQADGKLLIGGDFTEVNGNARSRLARLETDGSLDPNFQPNPNGEVRCLLVLDDERIYAGGFYGSISGTSREYLARLYSDGSIDLSFNPDISGGPVNSIAGQPFSKIVIGGQFSTVSGLNRGAFARLSSGGAADTSHSVNIGASNIWALAAQTDGKNLLSGPFSELGATWRYGIGRVNENGSLDTTFHPDTWEGATSAALLESGKFLLAGNFGTVGGLPQNAVARLINGPATDSLTVTGPTAVQWLRGGSSPETTQVSFDFSEDDRNTWTPLGHGVRIPGGWQMAGGVLPVSGHVRARARIHGGLYGGSSGLVESETAFGVAPAAEITVEAPAMTPLSDGGTLDFGIAPSTGGTVVTIQIKNTGPAPLTGLQTSLEPPTGSDFSIITPPTAPLARGETTQLVVRFAPATAGNKSATLQILSNDEDEPSFDLTLTGRALAPGITSGLTSETVDFGEDHTLMLTATGSPQLAYQWYLGPLGNVDQPVGTNSPELATGPVSATTSYWVRVSNSFGHADSAATISVNFPPTISAIEDQSTGEDTVTTAILFSIGDLETAADALILNVSSNNQSLAPRSNIVISGSGANRQIVITPLTNQYGEATINLTVTDGRLFTTESFLLVVEPINDAPSISNITDQALPINAIDSPIAFTVGDVDDGPSSLLLSATSSNTALLANEGISFGDSGASRVLIVSPVADQYGTTTI